MDEVDLYYRVKYDKEGNVVINKEDIIECVMQLDDKALEEFMSVVGAMVIQLCLEQDDKIDGTSFIT